MQHVGGCEYVCLYTVCELLGLYSTIATVAIEMAVTVCCYQFLLSFLGATKTFSLLGTMSCLQPPCLRWGRLGWWFPFSRWGAEGIVPITGCFTLLSLSVMFLRNYDSLSVLCIFSIPKKCYREVWYDFTGPLKSSSGSRRSNFQSIRLS